MSPSIPRVKTLDGMDIGSAYPARLVHALLRKREDSENDEWLIGALRELADATMSESVWTPYRWLRGTATPRTKVVGRLERLAGEWAVALPEPDPDEAEAANDTAEDAEGEVLADESPPAA